MSTDQFSVDGDVAIVTGSSSGIGRGIAERFAADGVDVVVCSREQENVDPVAEEINESERPGEALAVECDVTDRDAVEALVEATVEEFGGLDVLVNNAGASFMATVAYEGPDGTAEETVDAGNITDSGKVQGLRIKLEDGYIHLPYTRVYWVRMSKDEGRADYSSA